MVTPDVVDLVDVVDILDALVDDSAAAVGPGRIRATATALTQSSESIERFERGRSSRRRTGRPQVESLGA
jgi:hypothetical protein